jgi:hypothetical protein
MKKAEMADGMEGSGDQSSANLRRFPHPIRGPDSGEGLRRGDDLTVVQDGMKVNAEAEGRRRRALGLRPPPQHCNALSLP